MMRSGFWLFLLVLGGCGSSEPLEVETSVAQSGLHIDDARRWTLTWILPGGNLHKHFMPIPVCWLEPGNDGEKYWVREAVERTWVAHSRVMFTGWNTCTKANHGYGIRIHLEDTRSSAPLGTDESLFDEQQPISPTNRPMTLNVTYAAWDPANFCSRNREQCVRWTAVHEFGHALGFRHEQDRGDHAAAQQACVNALDTGSGRGRTLGPWDLDSVMNYCNDPTYNPGGTMQNYMTDGRLSPGDIMGVQLAYGRKHGGAVVAPERGRCLTSDNADNGAPALLHGCNPYRDTHVWSWFDGGLKQNAGRCLDVRANFQWFWTPLQVWDCLTQQPNQKFTVTNMQMRVLANKCVHATGNYVGADVVLGDCSGGDLDRWSFAGASQVKLAAKDALGSDLCLDVWGGNANFSPIKLGACAFANANKQWQLRSGGGLAAFNGATATDGKSRCLDVYNFDTRNGAPIYAWECNGLLNQAVSLRGKLLAYAQDGTQAWYVDRASDEEAVVPHIQASLPSPTQEWQFYP